MKNLKAKDYLGKARLVAASDRANAFTGFAGAEIKRMNSEAAAGTNAKDDRPDEKISFAATNLVKPGLSSRSRQQSEPPINRNMFPPTPPPEETRASPNGMTSRSQSVRGEGRKPAPLELGRAAFDQSPKSQQPRMPQRSMSERPRPTRELSTSSRSTREGGSRLRPRITSDEDESMYAEDVYDMYGRTGGDRPSYGGRSRSRPQQRPMYIEEEEEDSFDQSDIDSGEFEMVPTRARSTGRPSSNRPRGQSQRRSMGLRTIRVKVHADDTRYVFLDPNARFDAFVGQIRDKFALRASFKIKIKDEQDMITMSDQDDLDMAIMTCKQEARREKAEMGKMEVSSAQIVQVTIQGFKLTDSIADLGASCVGALILYVSHDFMASTLLLSSNLFSFVLSSIVKNYSLQCGSCLLMILSEHEKGHVRRRSRFSGLFRSSR